MVKYKGFEIEPVYYVSAGWKLDKNGCVKTRKLKSSDIEYYQIIDNGRNWVAEFTMRLCKQTIDSFLIENGLKKNTVD